LKIREENTMIFVTFVKGCVAMLTGSMPHDKQQSSPATTAGHHFELQAPMIASRPKSTVVETMAVTVDNAVSPVVTTSPSMHKSLIKRQNENGFVGWEWNSPVTSCKKSIN
jgi:hypothetical protein